ncbi:MAG: lamin tail domain-containing protein [Candidatus Krumholzibacteriia bacterium]
MSHGRSRVVAAARLWGATVLVVPSCAAAAIVLNEVLYDPAGADAGREFVELFNPGPRAVCLAGYRIETANGADASPVWSTRWTGAAADTIGPGGWFLVVDTGWAGSPAGAATATLALQNGPDALRLVRPGAGVDRLGYGALGAPEFYEGTPHPGVRSGQSLARRPDGRDTDDNATDWVARDLPTPGQPNFATRAVSVESLTAEPPALATAGWPVTVALRLRNDGLEPLPAGLTRLLALPVREGAARPESTAAWLEAIGSGEARVLSFTWTPAAEGRRRLLLTTSPDSCGPGLSVPAGDYQVGPAGPYLSEVMAAPLPGGGEWVEVGNGGEQECALDALKWRDEDGAWRRLPARVLAPGELVVLTADLSRLLAWWRGAAREGDMACGAASLAERALEPTGAWPSLNNSPPEGRAFADRLQLADSAGTVLDCVVIGADGLAVPAGRSLERAWLRPRGHPARNWGPSSAAAGATPGCPNALSLAAPPAAAPALRPNPFVPAAGAVLHVQFALAGPECAWEARIFDLWGRHVRDLGGDALGPGARDAVWDGRDDDGEAVASGGYVVVVRRFAADGGLLGSARCLAVVDAERGRP